MSVCAYRTDEPGFFTSCARVCVGKACRCGADVAAELVAAAVAEEEVGGDA